MVPELVEVRVKSVLNRVCGMGFEWSVNPYRGCAHGCPFCYARRTHWFLDEDGVGRWSTRIFVKVNAREVLRRELARPSWKRDLVAVGTATDPYQPAEARYRITRSILQVLAEFRTPASLVTRSPLVLRDVDVLQDLARRAGATVCVSLVTLDPELARQLEPTVALPRHRLQAVQRLSQAGIRTGVMLAPVLPGITDDPDNLEAVVRAAAESGAHFVAHNVLHLGEVTREAFRAFLEARYPHLVRVYQALYPRRYAPSGYRREVALRVTQLKRKVRFKAGGVLQPPSAPQQLALL
ncbi:MAG: radical SAM protein [Armatimonadota bacterium]|nr:radical SAM protein [Armatimonadota bacterium]MDW8155916.1 radical SAM protein [Armatimonadota bacterium]